MSHEFKRSAELRQILTGISFLILFQSCLGTSGGGGASSSSTGSIGEVRFDIQGAQALLLLGKNSSDSSGLRTSEASPFLTSTEVVSNLQRLASDGTIGPAVSLRSGGGSQSASSDSSRSKPGQEVIISQIDIAPTREAYVLFDSVVTVNGVDCAWVVVDPNNVADCADRDITPPAEQMNWLDQVTFDKDGNVLYGVSFTSVWPVTPFLKNIFSSAGNLIVTGVRERNRKTGQRASLLNAKTISLEIKRFLSAPDDSLVLTGDLEGTSREFFRFVPSSNGKGRLEDLDVHKVYDPFRNSFLLAPDGTLYVLALDEGAPVRKGSFQDGKLVFSDLSGGSTSTSGGELVQDSQGNVYSFNSNLGKVVFLKEGAFEAFTVSSIKTVEISKVSGDYLYVAGKNSDGDRVLIRKHLIGSREEKNLLGDRNLLVQHFDVSATGDVYFGAVDLNTTTVFLYKYNHETDSLEQLSSLAGDLTQIVLLQ